MYLPSHFAETDRDVLHGLMQEHSLSTLVTMTAAGLDANHIPLLLTPDEGEHGVLRGHLARANPIWKQYQAATEWRSFRVLMPIFHRPGIPASMSTAKQYRPGTMPLRIIDDAVWLREQLGLLTTCHESTLPQPWTIDDAPADFIEKMLSAVVGIEITITGLAGKWKLSQNQPAANRAGVIDGLHARGQADAAAMAMLVAQKTDCRAT